MARHAEMAQHPRTTPLVINDRLQRLQPSGPFSPASTLSHYASPTRPQYPEQAHFSPSHDSFISKPSISDASHLSSTPSVASSESDQQPTPRPSRQAGSHKTSSRTHGRHSERYSQRSSRDLERLTVDVPYSPRSVHSLQSPHGARGPVVLSDAHTTVTYNDGRKEWNEQRALESRALSTLLYLSGPAVAVSFLILFWTLIATILVLVLQPLRLFKSRPPFSTELINLLSPALRLQLRLIHSASASANEYKTSCLVSTHLFSPVVSFGVAAASWVAAFFWFFSAVLGDPAGQDGFDDGRSTVMTVRAWWERWLCRAIA